MFSQHAQMPSTAKSPNSSDGVLLHKSCPPKTLSPFLEQELQKMNVILRGSWDHSVECSDPRSLWLPHCQCTPKYLQPDSLLVQNISWALANTSWVHFWRYCGVRSWWKVGKSKEKGSHYFTVLLTITLLKGFITFLQPLVLHKFGRVLLQLILPKGYSFQRPWRKRQPRRKGSLTLFYHSFIKKKIYKI